MNLGQKIKTLRLERGISQKEFAKALCVTSQAVSKWEHGHTFPDIETIPVIASFFGISIDELFK